MCYNPIRLQNGLEVGCGHCMACLKHYQDMWTARLSEEVKSWRKVNDFAPVVFFTLKYRNDSIPCRYLVCCENGYRFSESKPDCTIYPFWTELKEGKDKWKKRKAEYLEFYRRWYNDTVRFLNFERRLDAIDPHDREYIRAGQFEVRRHFGFGASAVLTEDLPVSEGFEPFEMPVSTYGDALFAFEFHTVRKSDVQGWMKRGRRALEYHLPDVFASEDGVNPRFNSSWIDYDGNEHSLPSCAVPKSVKFFLTSEYGPQTFRPHMHGVMFGVTYDEFQEYFAKDWQEHFGSVDFSVFDPARGAMSYVAKYCSKGGYEHPYCSKDFFYPSGLEYHSCDFEYCIRDFNINEPMVERTFHLLSKGLGVSYAFRNEIMQYFGTAYKPVTTPAGSLRYVCEDSKPLGVLPSLDIMDATFAKCSNSIEFREVPEGLLISKYSKPIQDSSSILVGQSIVPLHAPSNELLENQLLNKQYHRVYVKTNHLPGCAAQGVRAGRFHPKWHLIGHNVCGAEVKETAISLPRYYRQWLFSPLVSALRASAASRLYTSPLERLSREIQSSGQSYPCLAVFEQALAGEAFKKYDTCTRLRKSAEMFYCQSSGIEELD